MRPEEPPPGPPPPAPRLPLVEPSPEEPRASELLPALDDEREEELRELDDLPLNRDVAAWKAADVDVVDPEVILDADELLLEPDELDELELLLDEELEDEEIEPELRFAAVLTEGTSMLVRPRNPPRIRGALMAT